jgi:hypothetical protein
VIISSQNFLFNFSVGHEYIINCYLSSDVKSEQIVPEVLSTVIKVNLIFINFIYYNCLLMEQLI